MSVSGTMSWKIGGALALMLLAAGLVGCKSNRSCRGSNCAPTTEQAPVFADVEPSYPPAAPSYPAEAPPATVLTTPAVDQTAALDAARDREELARKRAQALADQLARETAARRANEAKLDEIQAKLADLDHPPAGVPAQPDLRVPEVTSADRLLQELRARVQGDVLREGDMVIVRVTNSFKAGSDLLRKDVQLISTLNATADALKRYRGATVAVVGHSDGDKIKKSGWESNEALSLARAQRVASVLADNGVNKDRISIDGMGFRRPLVAQEHSRADKARNRRVEIMIRL